MAQTQKARIVASLSGGYERLKELVRADAKAPDVAELLANLTSKALDFLSSCKQIPLVSKVHGKTYFAFTMKRSGKLSRAVNAELFNPNTRRQLSYLVDGTLNNLAVIDRSRPISFLTLALGDRSFTYR